MMKDIFIYKLADNTRDFSHEWFSYRKVGALYMNDSIFKRRLDEKGFSLVEVIASIVILTIILVSVFSMLTQSAKTSKSSENIVDATYVAQSEMENLYALAKKTAFSSHATTIINEGYTNVDASGNPLGYYEKTDSYYIKLTVRDISDKYTSLTRIVIQVYDKKGGILKSQMENTLQWKAG